MAKTWNSGEPSQEWPADQNYPKRAAMTHPRGHKNPQNNTQRTAGLTWLSYGQVFMTL